jgi:phosphatidylserine decarboxylase
MNEFVKFPHSPLAEEGWWLIALPLLVSIFCFSVGRIYFNSIGVLSLLVFIFSVWFFRNPTRIPASTEINAILSSADGSVLKVEHVSDPRYGAPAEKISIFMSPFDVHVNRAPISGTVEKAEYVPGKFFSAYLDKASEENERNFVILKTEKGERIGFLQIAGFLARRIVCHVHPGDHLRVGQRYGMIRFGSRMELFLPAGSKILVQPGDRVLAGQTVIGFL